MQFKKFCLIYAVHRQTEELVSQNFSVFENEHLSIEFLLEDIMGDKVYKVHIVPKVEIEFLDFYIETSFDYSETRGIFCNGFQSWTETKIFNKEDKLAGQRKFIKKIAEAYGDELFYDYKNKKGIVHSWTYTYIKLPKRRIQFLGSLDDKNGYTIFEHHARENKIVIKKDCKGFVTNEAFELLNIFASVSHEKISFDNYFDAQQLTPVKVKPAMGWTSWYYYYTNISEKIIDENLDAFVKNKIPIEIFQIDDGYQEAVGDWLNFNERFPNGLKNIVEKIHQQNIKAGLWLAPLTCEHNSFIVREHPDWIIKNDKGKFLKIGFNPMWSYWFYALDVYHPEVRAYLKKVFDTVLNDWNFDLVKLDFLYGAALTSRNGKSRGQIMHDVMQFLRECVGEKMILGCGVPLIAANGTTDYCRIGPDIHMDWDFKLLKWIRARERPSTQNAIHNTISRRQLSGHWFLNDPDVFVLRKNKNSLLFEEKYSLLLANLLFGHLLFTSDNIGEYDEATLRLYKSIFPLMQIGDADVSYKDEFYAIRFRIGERNFLVLINTSDYSKMYKLPETLLFDNVKDDFIKGGKMMEVPKHASKCYLVVGHTPFAVAGSKGHFFAGTEIESIYLSGNKIELEWTPGIPDDAKVYIKVPPEYNVESINNSGNFLRIEKKYFSIIEVEKHKL